MRAVRPAQIYHLAGVPHVGGSWDATTPTLAGNVLATHYLFDALRRAGVRARVLVTASATVYAPSDQPIAEDGAIAPGSPYALSKLAQEMRTLRAPSEDGLDVIVVRAFNHTGPRQAPAFAAPSFARQIARIERGEQEPVIRAGNLAPRRDLSDVRDVVRAYAALMERGAGGGVYNVASGVGRPIGDILARARRPRARHGHRRDRLGAAAPQRHRRARRRLQPSAARHRLEPADSLREDAGRPAGVLENSVGSRRPAPGFSW